MTSADHAFGFANLVRNKAIPLRGGDPLPRLLAQLAARAGPGATIERATSRPWASALFQGRRHVVVLRCADADAAAQFADGLDAAEWTLPRHFVADIVVDARHSDATGEWLELSALTIEYW